MKEVHVEGAVEMVCAVLKEVQRTLAQLILPRERLEIMAHRWSPLRWQRMAHQATMGQCWDVGWR